MLRTAGRVDLDTVEHAQLDMEKAEVTLHVLASHRQLTDWDVARAFEPSGFAPMLLKRIAIEFIAGSQ
jgi:hypothetical protein